MWHIFHLFGVPKPILSSHWQTRTQREGSAQLCRCNTSVCSHGNAHGELSRRELDSGGRCFLHHVSVLIIWWRALSRWKFTTDGIFTTFCLGSTAFAIVSWMNNKKRRQATQMQSTTTHTHTRTHTHTHTHTHSHTDSCVPDPLLSLKLLSKKIIDAKQQLKYMCADKRTK